MVLPRHPGVAEAGHPPLRVGEAGERAEELVRHRALPFVAPEVDPRSPVWGFALRDVVEDPDCGLPALQARVLRPDHELAHVGHDLRVRRGDGELHGRVRRQVGRDRERRLRAAQEGAALLPAEPHPLVDAGPVGIGRGARPGRDAAPDPPADLVQGLERPEEVPRSALRLELDPRRPAGGDALEDPGHPVAGADGELGMDDGQRLLDGVVLNRDQVFEPARARHRVLVATCIGHGKPPLDAAYDRRIEPGRQAGARPLEMR